MPPIRFHSVSRLVVIAALAGIASFRSASAQLCQTPNCRTAAKPAECANIAAARIPLVHLTVSGVNFVFVPSDPKIEPGDCIQWMADNVTHSSSENHANAADDTCAGAPPAGTLWDSGNIVSGGANNIAFCAYSPVTFPAGTGNGYFCRIHATATTGTMRGTLRVTTPIQLQIDKSGADAKLSWTGGGIPGDITYKVAKSANDPTFTPVNVQTLNPDGGVTGTTLTDVGALADPTTRYYLARNRQTNE